MPRAAVAGVPTKSIAPAMPASCCAACGSRVSSVYFAPSFAAVSSFRGSMSQATMCFTPRAQHRDAGKADAAAADDRHAVLAREQRQLGARAVGREARAGERRSESLVDTGSVEQVFRIGHEQVRRIGAGAVDAEDAASRDTVVVLSRLAHRALAAADPRKHDPLLTHAHALRLRAQRLDHAEGLMAEREGRHAAALLDVEALAAAEVEIAMPD